MKYRFALPVSVLAGLTVLLAAPVPADAGLGCTDVCGPRDETGANCLDLGQGCNPFTNVCFPCQDDTYCAPGGTCQPDGSCAGVVCGGTDAGTPDATPDSGTGTGTVADAGFTDAGNPVDTGVVDTGTGTGTVSDGGTADSGAPADAQVAQDSGATRPDTGPRAGIIPYDGPMYDEGCTCLATEAGDRGPTALFGLLFAGLVARRRRRR